MFTGRQGHNHSLDIIVFGYKFQMRCSIVLYVFVINGSEMCAEDKCIDFKVSRSRRRVTSLYNEIAHIFFPEFLVSLVTKTVEQNLKHEIIP